MPLDDTSSISTLGATVVIPEVMKHAAALRVAHRIDSHGDTHQQVLETLQMLGILPSNGADTRDPWGGIDSGKVARHARDASAKEAS